jgi:prepilin-type N-terminal cleavage/methylation domain-containing protein
VKKGGKVKDRGITLVELIATVSVISVLLVLSYFSFDDWMARYRV